jgi:hypothetical protein
MAEPRLGDVGRLKKGEHYDPMLLSGKLLCSIFYLHEKKKCYLFLDDYSLLGCNTMLLLDSYQHFRETYCLSL